MELVAYLYAATAYDDSEATSEGMEDGFTTTPTVYWPQVSPQTATSLLAIACSLSVLGTAGAASALQRNDVGTDVTTLQTDLMRAGYYSGPVTGFYGELTESAVTRFQSENGLAVDGVAGSETIATLQSRVSATQAPHTIAAETLRWGDQGAAVTDLQTRLRRAGYFNGPVTGYFGSLTETAVRRFQAQKGLTVDGEAGTQTLAALRQTTTASTANPTRSAQGGPATSVDDGILQRGDRGTPVANLQSRLRNAGYFEGPMTGFYGSLTEEAVVNFQRAKGLTVDGKAGPRTLGALLQSPSPSQSGQPSNTATRPDPNPQSTTAQRSPSPNPQPTAQASARPTPAQPNPTTPNVSPSPNSPTAAVPNTTRSATTNDVLERGDGGPEVAALQTALKQANYLDGQVTGFFGQLTEQALIKFQTDNGLPATGKADAATLSALQTRSSTTSPTVVLKQGDSGAAVADLQNRLRLAGFFDGPMTGYYGELTTEAVTEFQRSKGLPADGKAGAQTLAALRQ